MKADILQQQHTGHQGISKTQRWARYSVNWINFNKEIERMCKSCQVCQEYQEEQRKAPLFPYPTPSRPWQFISSDIFSISDKSYLLVVDRFSKYPLVATNQPCSGWSDQTLLCHLWSAGYDNQWQWDTIYRISLPGIHLRVEYWSYHKFSKLPPQQRTSRKTCETCEESNKKSHQESPGHTDCTHEHSCNPNWWTTTLPSRNLIEEAIDYFVTKSRRTSPSRATWRAWTPAGQYENLPWQKKPEGRVASSLQRATHPYPGQNQ